MGVRLRLTLPLGEASEAGSRGVTTPAPSRAGAVSAVVGQCVAEVSPNDDPREAARVRPFAPD